MLKFKAKSEKKNNFGTINQIEKHRPAEVQDSVEKAKLPLRVSGKENSVPLNETFCPGQTAKKSFHSLIFSEFTGLFYY